MRHIDDDEAYELAQSAWAEVNDAVEPKTLTDMSLLVVKR